MPSHYSYPLWNGKEIVGYYTTMSSLRDCDTLFVDYNSILKHKYNVKRRVIKVPIITQLLSDDGVTFTMQRRLDVRRKSKNQIALLMLGGP